MKITIYSIGKTKESFVLAGETEYLKRLKSYAPVEIKEIGPKTKEGSSPDEMKLKEADILLDSVSDGELFIALDERGTELSSTEFSQFLSTKMTQGNSRFSFAIGGAWGFHEQVRKRANLVLSLSKMTFPHQLARLYLIEQLYRAFSIMRGEPYHK